MGYPQASSIPSSKLLTSLPALVPLITHPALWKDLPTPTFSAHDGKDFILQGHLSHGQGPLIPEGP